MPPYPNNPHFAFPFIMQTGKASVREQDDDDEIFDCLTVYLSTPRGSLLHAPEFGITDPTFKSPVNVPQIQSGLRRFDDRANALISAQPDALDSAITRVNVEARRSEDA